MTNTRLFWAAFFTTCAASVGLAWLSGYNFDHRSFDVAIWVVCTPVMAAYTGSLVVEIHERCSED